MVSGRSVWSRVVAPTAVTAVLSTALAVAVNIATGGGPWWVWALVAVLTVAVFAVSLWIQLTGSAPAAGTPPVAGVDLRNARSDGAMRFEGIRAPGPAVRARDLASKGDMSFKDLDAGHGGGASHP
ncbi:hypothetical protein OG225_06970 [Nocardia sp. NBC_01377]|uniref:hypothetical protein n=1 Tax=Nocardia sp. NBC_01377 TaxID=2903595 RepID=UPI00324F66F8